MDDTLLLQQRQVLNLFERIAEPFAPHPDIGFKIPEIVVNITRRFLL